MNLGVLFINSMPIPQFTDSYLVLYGLKTGNEERFGYRGSSCGPVDLWTCGPVDLWTCGPEDLCGLWVVDGTSMVYVAGGVDLRTSGPVDQGFSL